GTPGHFGGRGFFMPSACSRPCRGIAGVWRAERARGRSPLPRGRSASDERGKQPDRARSASSAASTYPVRLLALLTGTPSFSSVPEYRVSSPESICDRLSSRLRDGESTCPHLGSIEEGRRRDERSEAAFCWEDP